MTELATAASAVATSYDRGVVAVVGDAEVVREGRWVPTGTGIALRVLAAVILTYFSVVGGAYRVGFVLGVVSSFAMVSPFVAIGSRLLGRDRVATAAVVVMMVCGAVTTPYTNFATGSYYFCGAILLISRMGLPLRATIFLAGAGGALLLASVALASQRQDLDARLLGYGAGILAAVFFAITRRQAHQREVQNQALVARSRELERRSAELIAQTELTRSESTRAAALEERSRIARDIHDVLAHSLGGLVVQLDAAEALLTERQDLAAAAERLRSARQLAVDGLREARLAVSELRDPNHDAHAETDLVAAVRHAAYGPVGLHLGAELDVLGDATTVPGEVRDALVAVLREALTNVTKHAPAGPVAVSLVFDGPVVRLEVGNALPGQPPTELAGTGSGSGLAGMRERMAAIGGTLTAEPIGLRWMLVAEWTRA